MSLYYDLNNDVDLMNFLMEKHGYSLAMIKFNKIKTDSGYHQKTSYEGGAQITRWVKNKKKTKPDAKDAKPDAKDAKDAKPDAKDAKPDAKDAKPAPPNIVQPRSGLPIFGGGCWGATLTRDEAWEAGLGGAGGDYVFGSQSRSTY